MDGELDSLLANFSKPRHFVQNIYAVSDDRMRCPLIYVRNHKAACTSAILSLFQRSALLDGSDTEKPDIHDLHSRSGSAFGNTRKLGNLRTYKLAQSRETLTFSFVRHPLKRAASAFADKISNSPRHRSKLLRTLGRSVDDEISFSEFVRLIATNPEILDLDRHWRPQHKELATNALKYDFLGAIENMNRDLAAILDFGFGARVAKIADARTTFGHRTSSAELLDALPLKDRRAFEKALQPDYELYEKVLENKFDETAVTVQAATKAANSGS